MNSRKSFEFFDGQFYPPSNVISAIKSEVSNTTGAGKNVRLHLHIAGPSGRGKTYISYFIAKTMKLIFDANDQGLTVGVLSFEDFIVDPLDRTADIQVLASKLTESLDETSKEGQIMSLLITEGQVSNEVDCFAEIATSGVFDISVCCIVEPSIGTFASINRAKCKDANIANRDWKSHYEKIAKKNVLEMIDLIAIDTVNSHRLWSKLCPVVVTIGNHASRAITIANHEDVDDLFNTLITIK